MCIHIHIHKHIHIYTVLTYSVFFSLAEQPTTHPKVAACVMPRWCSEAQVKLAAMHVHEGETTNVGARERKKEGVSVYDRQVYPHVFSGDVHGGEWKKEENGGGYNRNTPLLRIVGLQHQVTHSNVFFLTRYYCFFCSCFLEFLCYLCLFMREGRLRLFFSLRHSVTFAFKRIFLLALCVSSL